MAKRHGDNGVTKGCDQSKNEMENSVGKFNHDFHRRPDNFYESDTNSDPETEKEETALLSNKHRPDYRSTLSFSYQKIILSWRNLNVSARSKKKHFFQRKSTHREIILKNVSGGVESGQLIAIMGASGSGKTTLLNILTSRNIKNFLVEGEVRLNGQDVGRNITAVSAYVQQNDLFVGTLTVREHLVFQALLRLPKEMSRAEKIARADSVIFELGLRKCSKTRIGIPGMMKGISGGESKRLAFASEILRNPPILFCDEPTTGIDSFMARSVVSVLQKMASRGKAILCTIHQPTSDIYAMFDRVLFLAEGRVAYLGPTKEALGFFSKQGYQCPEDYNPSDFFIHTLAVVPTKETECRERIKAICDAYEKSEYAESVDHYKRQHESSSFISSEDISKKSPYNAGWPLQFILLLWLSLLYGFRNRNLVLAKVCQKVVLGLFLGLLYLNNTLNQINIMNYNGALFFILAEMAFPATFGILALLPSEFPLLVREHHNGMYKISSYYLAKVVSFVITFSIDAVIFISISYFMIGLRPAADAFFITLALSILVAQCSCAFGCIISAISPSSTALAIALMTPLETILFMVAGYFANIVSIPVYLSWMQYLSWFRYAFEAYAVNQWHPIKNITCETPNKACLTTGDEVLAQLNFYPGNLLNDILLMMALFVGMHIIGYLALWWRTYKAR